MPKPDPLKVMRDALEAVERESGVYGDEGYNGGQMIAETAVSMMAARLLAAIEKAQRDAEFAEENDV